MNIHNKKIKHKIIIYYFHLLNQYILFFHLYLVISVIVLNHLSTFEYYQCYKYYIHILHNYHNILYFYFHLN